MTAISPSTQRRLQKLPQLPTVWEGDRRKMTNLVDELEDDDRRELLVWVDGVECIVRSMEVINEAMGPEAIVRALIKAMESPQAPAQPARPQKIIVCDRQLQFYLRGVLQDLDIIVDYVPELPIVDELFNRFTDMGDGVAKLPRKYLDRLKATARELWALAPWELLADYEVISIELNRWDVDRFYVSVMGMLGMEYGVLLYRSIDSLRRFRAMALNDDQAIEMESAFLSQDCIFVTFEASTPDLDGDLASLPANSIEPSFGNIHPMEGMRQFLYEEEAVAAQVALAAFTRFLALAKVALSADDLPRITKKVKVKFPDLDQMQSVTVATLTELSAELLKMHLDLADDPDEFDPVELQIQEDLIPNDSLISLGMMPWDRVDTIRQSVKYHQLSEIQFAGEGLPIILIQTTRPKAAEIVNRIQAAGGLAGICFNPGEDPHQGTSFDLGILQLADGELQLFGEFDHQSTVHIEAHRKWNQRSKKTKGYCGLLVAYGATGKARGNPGLKETVAFLETKSLTNDDLGLGTLQLVRDLEI